MSRPQYPLCARCTVHACRPNSTVEDTHIDLGSAPPFCPMKLHADVLADAVLKYQDEKVREFACQASIQEGDCFERTEGVLRTRIPRIEETMQFAKKMHYKRLGIAFCLGLASEAATLSTIFERKNFEVVSVCCKVGGIAKEDLGVNPEKKIVGPNMYESMCNPIAQAEIINAEKCDFAVVVGLCVGHDTLFIKNCNVPITVLAAKDRVLAHNPLGALYTSSSYYEQLLRKENYIG
jgi:uncharacterized metal-binding protein